MTDSYEDILHLPHHVSAKRRRMSNAERAAQFSPFAALTSYGEAEVGALRRIDEYNHVIVMENGLEIPMEDIFDLKAERKSEE